MGNSVKVLRVQSKERPSEKRLRIFISTPSDVEIEPRIALQVIERIEAKYHRYWS